MKKIINRLYGTIGIKNSILIFYGILLFILVFAISFFAYKKMEATYKMEAELSLKETIDQVDKNIDYQLRMYEVVLNNIIVNEILITSLAKDPKDSYEGFLIIRDIEKAIASIRNLYPDIKKIEIFTNGSKYMVNSHIIFPASDEDKWFKDFMSKKPSYTQWKYREAYEINTYRKENIIQLSKKISDFDRDRILGVMRISIEANEIYEMLEGFSVGKGTEIALYDSHNSVIFKSPGIQNDFAATILNRIKTNKLEAIRYNSRKKGVVYSTAGNIAGFKVVSIFPMDTFKESINSIQIFIIILSLIVILLGFTVDYLFSKSITSSIITLIKKIEKVSAGNLKVQCEKYYGKDEIGYLNEQFDTMVEKINVLFKDVYESKIKQRENEIKALQSQINPHFLYNTLSSINWMAIERGAFDVSHAINSLAKYYRLTISKGRQIIKVSEEIQHIKAYVEIQQIRFKDKFFVDYMIDNAVMNFMMPKIILQPFVENAIIHGMENMEHPCGLMVKINSADGIIEFIIKDEGKGISPEILREIKESKAKNKGYGIRNVDERIKLLYGDNYGVTIRSKKREGTTVIISLPQILQEENINA